MREAGGVSSFLPSSHVHPARTFLLCSFLVDFLTGNEGSCTSLENIYILWPLLLKMRSGPFVVSL